MLTQHRASLRRRCASAHEAAAAIPREIHREWVARAGVELRGLRVDELTWLYCSVALAQFFEVCSNEPRQGSCALPSKAADSVWHVWLAVDPAGLSAWQREHFGRELPHREHGALGGPAEASLARTWVGACRSQRINALGPQMPLVFELDRQLSVPGGWSYRHEGGALVHRRLDAAGQPTGSPVPHPGVLGGSLLALGLVSEAELAEYQRRNDAGSSCGSSSGPDGVDGDGCGSSCGSGCGD